jgi:predicted metal-binding protein
MQLHTLFVCKSCSAVLDHEEADDRAEGNQLLLKLLETQKNNSTYNSINIKPVGCLWTCVKKHSCAVSFVCPQKYTYHFVDLTQESITDLLEFSLLYQQSQDGYILPAKIPGTLRSYLLVRIPPTPEAATLATEV